MSIYDKLGSIQFNLNAPKGQHNEFGHYNYRSCEDILAAAKPLLLAQRCTITLTDEIVMFGDRYYVKATAALTDIESGERVAVTAYAREDGAKKGMDGSQITGSSSSYARKYALSGLFAIDDNKDADTRSPDENEIVCRCADCRAIIQGYEKNGKPISADQWIQTSRQRYGVALCTACATIREEDKK